MEVKPDMRTDIPDLWEESQALADPDNELWAGISIHAAAEPAKIDAGMYSKYFRLVPEKYLEHAVIAGGAAVDLILADDIDIFILCGSMNWEDAIFDLRELLTEKHADFSPRNPEDDDEYGDCAVVGELTLDGDTVQFMVAKHAASATSLLETFDISTHQVAIDHTGFIQRCKTTTFSTQTPRIVHVTKASLTLARYHKICQRYGLKPDMKEIEKTFNYQ